MAAPFVIAHNPVEGSRLPVLVRLPLPDGPLTLATRDTWPATRDLYCHELDDWPLGAETVEEVPVVRCRRRGASIELVLARRARRRSLFVFTSKRGRPLIFWRSDATARTARPGVRVPGARGLERPLTIAIDDRERYPWRFAGKEARVERRRLPAGDYAVLADGRVIAAIERKRPAELATQAVAGRLSLLMTELSSLPRAAVIVEGRLSDVIKAADAQQVRSGWVPSVLASVQADHPRVPLLFAETPKLAGDLAYRWLAACARRDREGQGRLFDAGPPTDGNGAPEASGDEPIHRDAPLAGPDRRAQALKEARAGAVWTGPGYAERFGVSRATAQADLRLLRDEGSLVAEGRTRSLRYRA
ncbi:MAG: hypothetical protein GVY27_03090, partial [Deinococcus-Thermus bacterium]|nr:hypothetical protein [Deinococcota bacterium]